MSLSGNGADLSLLLPDVAWYQRRAAQALLIAWILFALGLPMMIRLVVVIRATILNPHEEDPAGPIDAFVLLCGMVLEAIAVMLFHWASARRRTAAAVASWQVRGADGGRIAASALRRPISSMPRLRRWLDRRRASVVASSGLPDPERRMQLFLAARGRPGTRQERSDRFGESIAIDYERSLVLRRSVAVLISLAIICVGVIAAIGYIVDRNASGPYQVGRLMLLALPVLIPFVGVALRRSALGFGPVLARMMPVLRPRDGGIDRNTALAMLVKPRLHEIWTELHPLTP